MENLYVAYYRVSTKKQGESGLGLEAQRSIVMNYIKNNGNKIIAEFTEVESGRHDNRLELQKALSKCRETSAVLIIAKLDRLSRNVSFISNLMDAGIKFCCADMPEMNELTCHIFAALAQWERKRISERICEALEAKRKREPNWKAGKDNLTDAGRKKAYVTIKSNSVNNESARKAYHFICLLKDQGLTYAEIADRLKMEHYTTRNGKSFTTMTVFDTFHKFKNLPEHKTAL
jgi:DNA invertase Pin-like site-specific DNA recombinase